MIQALVLTIIILFALVIGWHLVFPLIGGVIALTAAAWGMIIASVVALGIAILLIFIFTGTGIFVLGLFAFLWTLLAIVLFPILFPIVAPLFVIFLFISYLRRKQSQKNTKIS